MRRGLLLVLAACLLTACGAGPGDYRPLTSRAPDGTWSGIDVDMAGDLARGLGVRPVMVPTTWSTLLDDGSWQRFARPWLG